MKTTKILQEMRKVQRGCHICAESIDLDTNGDLRLMWKFIAKGEERKGCFSLLVDEDRLGWEVRTALAAAEMFFDTLAASGPPEIVEAATVWQNPRHPPAKPSRGRYEDVIKNP